MNREQLCLEINNILPNFRFNGKVEECVRYGNGHINDTFKVSVNGDDGVIDYIVQRINTDIFTDPDTLMNNISAVTDHLRKKVISNGGDTDREVMQIIPTLDGGLYCTDRNSSVWRAYRFVTDIVCLDAPSGSESMECAARAFGQFSGLLADFDAAVLGETIPHFHDTPRRYANLMKAFSQDKVGRADKVSQQILFAGERQKYTLLLQQSGIPLRVTHNDTKLNNILLDKNSLDAVCVIDLDTVMPGYSVTDFGDMIRFGVNTAAEDEPDLEKVKVDLELYEACVRGYIDGCNGQLTEQELSLLPDGARMMTFECGMRFLTDYLEGDTYFRTSYAEHNLVRCLNQFKLLSELEKLDAQIRNIVKKYL